MTATGNMSQHEFAGGNVQTDGEEEGEEQMEIQLHLLLVKTKTVTDVIPCNHSRHLVHGGC